MMLFKEEHVPMIVAGIPRLKTQTRRLHKRARALVGSHHWAQRGMTAESRFARLEMTRVWQERLWDISEDDVFAEGYANAAAYYGVFNAINKKKRKSLNDPNPTVWCYEFRVIEVMPLGRTITERLYAGAEVALDAGNAVS